MSVLENVTCPDCGGPMVSRKSQHGVFWGCKAFPKCRGTRDSMGQSLGERRAGRPSEDDERKPRRVRRWEQ